MGLLVGTLLRKRIKMQGFFAFEDYGQRWNAFAGEMGGWVQADQVKFGRTSCSVWRTRPKPSSVYCGAKNSASGSFRWHCKCA
jgi:hypothetical protein